MNAARDRVSAQVRRVLLDSGALSFRGTAKR